MSEAQYEFISYEQLHDFTMRVFLHNGVPEAEARRAAEVLTTSDVRGIESHGVARLPVYAGLLARGDINPRPKIRTVRETPSTATLDGDGGLGLVVGPKANDLAMEKAEQAGSGWVSVCGSSHFGIAGYYPLQALARDIIGWAMTNATPQVTPLWGARRTLGTNPIAIAFPGCEEPPIVIDMATSVTAYGKIEVARRKGESIPHGWTLDSDGQVTTDPNAMGPDYALLPLGSDRARGGHKGYCLASLVDVLCGVLSGANWGPFVPPFALDLAPPDEKVGTGIGHFFGAMRIDGFADPAEFKRRIDHWIRTLRKTKPAPGTEGPIIPGDPERKAEALRRREGIPLVAAVADALRTLSRETGVALEGLSPR